MGEGSEIPGSLLPHQIECDTNLLVTLVFRAGHLMAEHPILHMVDAGWIVSIVVHFRGPARRPSGDLIIGTSNAPDCARCAILTLVVRSSRGLM